MQKLNEKNARKKLTIENNARLGGPYPSTLFEAYKLISELADLPTINATSSSVFATTRTDAGGKKGGGKKSEEKDQDGSTKKEFTGKCFKCGKVGHRISQCPDAKDDSKKDGSKDDSKKDGSKKDETKNDSTKIHCD